MVAKKTNEILKSRRRRTNPAQVSKQLDEMVGALGAWILIMEVADWQGVEAMACAIERTGVVVI